MKRHSYNSGSRVQSHSHKLRAQVSPRLNWLTPPELISAKQEYQADTWVQLLELPSPFSYDEALLLCQHSQDKWVVWIPNHGEATLYTSQFCIAST